MSGGRPVMSALDRCVGCGSPRRPDQSFCRRCRQLLGIETNERPQPGGPLGQRGNDPTAPGRLLLVCLLAGVLAIAVFASRHGDHFPPPLANQHTTGSCLSC